MLVRRAKSKHTEASFSRFRRFHFDYGDFHGYDDDDKQTKRIACLIDHVTDPHQRMGMHAHNKESTHNHVHLGAIGEQQCRCTSHKNTHHTQSIANMYALNVMRMRVWAAND